MIFLIGAFKNVLFSNGGKKPADGTNRQRRSIKEDKGICSADLLFQG